MSEKDIHRFNQIEEQIAYLNSEREKIVESVKPKIDFVKEVLDEALGLGMSKRELALLIDPSLRELTEPRQRKAHRPRQTKIYTNPHSGDVIETKGGNHTILKGWKAQWGGDVVESWLTMKEE